MAWRAVRPRLVTGASALAMLGGWALWIEPRRLMVRRRRLALPGWRAELGGLRVAVVSDVHTGAPHVKERRLEMIVRAVNRERPDLVALLGDFVDPQVALGARVEPAAVARRLAGLRARLGVFAVLGNHDWAHGGGRMSRALKEVGVVTLENQAIAVAGTRQGLWIIGLADLTTRHPDLAEPFATVPEDASAIVLAHNPDVFVRIPKRAALTLSGHTHGGQVGFPRLRGRARPARSDRRSARGHIVEAGRHLFVTSGVGTSRVAVRLFAPPEIAILDLITD